MSQFIMVLKEFRICMPLSVEEYYRGQIYVISRHSKEQSEAGDGVETVLNEVCQHSVHGQGRKTIKKMHINNKLPKWAKAVCPSLYVLETAYNYYPYTTTEYTCPFLPALKILIETRYENNKGLNNVFPVSKIFENYPNEYELREIDHLDLAVDKVQDKHYKAEEDCTLFLSKKTGRGKLKPNWKETADPIMCSYKLVLVQFAVWGLQSRVERFIMNFIQETLLLAHRQAFTWIDSWFDMSEEEIRNYEKSSQLETNLKVREGNLAGEPSNM